MDKSSQHNLFSPSSQITPSQDGKTILATSERSARGNVLPVTVKQIFDAMKLDSGIQGAPFFVDGVETDIVKLVGTVDVESANSKSMSLVLDDGTGRLNFTRWLNHTSDKDEMFATLFSSVYCEFIGTLRGLRERNYATAISLRGITDYNAVTLHFLQCIRAHLHNTRDQEPTVDDGSKKIESSSGSTNTISPSQSTPGVAGITKTPAADLYIQVLNFIREQANLDDGLHIDEVLKQFKLPAVKIREAVQYNVDLGLIYTTIDDFHFKAA
ncbi:hypothetical protein ACP4OV_001544 [Aristida adscensionis]